MSNFGGDISTFAGPTGVGALGILGVFLFLDGRAPGFFPTFEQYAKTSSWNIVAAIPVLAVSYVLGLCLMIASERALTGVVGPSRKSEAADIALVGTAGAVKDSSVSQVYLEALRNRAVLCGGAVALLVLAFGALSDTSNLPNLRGVIVVAVIATSLLAVGAAYLALEEGHRAHKLAEAVAAMAPKPKP
jgi:hypothetical protein